MKIPFLSSISIFHRLEEEYELDDLGFDDYLESGVTVIEWSEKFPDRLPDDAAIVTIEKTSPTDRLFHFDFPRQPLEGCRKLR